MRNPYDTIGRIGLLLAIVGAVNWLLVGLFEWNLVQWIFTQSGTQTVDNMGERIVYIVVGVGGVLAIPMLAASLSRARGRDLRSDESSRSRDLDENDTAFYYGAPTDVRADRASRVAATSEESRTTEQKAPVRSEPSGPVRKTERVIVRTEEPIIGSTETATSTESVSGAHGTRESVSEGPDTGATDRDLRYGSVEEADDDLSEERRAA
jgi:uncharacterized membrane protein YuzA (DUF378 family)